MNDKAMNDRNMTDRDQAERNRELLSALMDGEASEHEVRQALRATGDDPALAATWQRYHLAQSALRGDAQAYASQSYVSVDLRAAIAGRLDAVDSSLDDANDAFSSRVQAAGRRAWLKPLASVAVAASVTVLTVFAWQVFQDSTSSFTTSDTVAVSASASEQHVALGPMVVVREDGEELVMPVAVASSMNSQGMNMPAVAAASADSPTAAQDRINAYLTRHAQAAGAANARGLAPYARVVSLEGEQGP